MRNKIAFITHYCTHYRIKTYETLAKYEQVTYYFYSAGKEWYWDQAHGVSSGNFKHEYLPGFQLGHTRIPYTLAAKLWQGKYDLYLKCINGKFALPLTYAVARIRRKPFILWTGIWMRLQSPLHRLAWPLTRYICRHADAIVTYGTHVERFLIAQGVETEKIFPTKHVVHNPDYNQPIAEHEISALREQLHIDERKKIVLFVGRLVEVKGLPYLLEAFARLYQPEAVLVIVGQGPQQAALHEQAKHLKITDQLRFVGYVPSDQMTAYYAMSWVHVLPSISTRIERETWGLVVNEAFNQGVPSIASNAVGAAAGGLVEDGKTGFVVPERDVDALAMHLRQVLTDSALRQKLSHGARETIAQWHNEAMVTEFRAAIHYALDQHNNKALNRRKKKAEA